MVIESSSSFLEVLEKSGLLSAEQFSIARDGAQQTDDPKALAWKLIHQELLTRWQAEQLLRGRTSFVWGKYRLIDMLGRGGMGTVYLARHTMMNRPVALKAISKQLEKDPVAMERFLVEARAIAALDHPNIVHAYSVDSEGDTYYMVLEYVEGHDLQQIVEKEGPLDFARAADYIRQAADGLAHAHSRGMIHCDIKPSNFLVNAQGTVKILDMGMARAIGKGESPGQESNPHHGNGQNGDGQSGAGQNENHPNGAHPEGSPLGGLVGTIDYMAPEQTAQTPDFNHRADIYSLGCTLYCLLTGHPPFPEGTLTERIIKHQTAEPRSILDERPTTPRDLVAICRKMMAKDPAERYQSCEEVSRALEEWHPPAVKVLKGTPLAETPSPLVTPGPAGADDELAIRTEDLANLEKAAAAGPLNLEAAIASSGPLNLEAIASSGPLNLAAIASSAAQGAAAPAALRPATIAAGSSSGKFRTKGFVSAQAKAAQRHQRIMLAGGAAIGVLVLALLIFFLTRSSGPSTGQQVAHPVAGNQPVGPPKDESKPPHPPEVKSAPQPPPNTAPKSPPSTAPQPPPGAAAKTQSGSGTVQKPPEPPKAPPNPAPSVDPFKDLKKIVDLPKLEYDADVKTLAVAELGKIHSGADPEINLLGGNTAVKGGRKFSMVRKDVQGKPGWLVSVSAGDRDGEEGGDVASLWRDKDALMFQWLASTPPANHLRNCILDIQAGGKSQSLVLRTSEKHDPVPIDLQHGMLSVPVVHWPPDPSALRFEVTGLEPAERTTKVNGKDVKEKWVLDQVRPGAFDPKTRLLLTLTVMYLDRNKDQVPSPIRFDVLLNAKSGTRGLAVDFGGLKRLPSWLLKNLQSNVTEGPSAERAARRADQEGRQCRKAWYGSESR